MFSLFAATWVIATVIQLCRISRREMTIKLTSLVVIAAFLMAFSGCSETYDFTGVVVDGDGVPISGASIFLRPHGWEAPSWDYKLDEPPTPGTMNTSDTDGTCLLYTSPSPRD